MSIALSAFFFLAILLQTTFFPIFFPGDIKPDFFLGLTLYIGLFYSPSRGMTCGIIAGALLDIFSEGIIGSNTFSLMVIGLFTAYIKNYVLTENLMIQTATIIVSTFFQWTIASIYKGTLETNPEFLKEFGYFLSVQMLLNILISFLIFSLFNFLKRNKYIKLSF